MGVGEARQGQAVERRASASGLLARNRRNPAVLDVDHHPGLRARPAQPRQLHQYDVEPTRSTSRRALDEGLPVETLELRPRGQRPESVT